MYSRILIVGSGNISHRHLGLAKELLPLAKVKRLRLTNSISRQNDLPEDIFSIEEAKEFRPEIAVICNPAPFHLEVAGEMSRLGAHLLIEKPISHSTDGVLDFIRQIEVQGRVLAIGYNLRFLESLREFRHLVSINYLGRTISVRCEVGQYLPNWRPRFDYQNSVSARRELGGGVLLELSHELDYLQWIFGEVSWVRATLIQQGSLNVNVEDTAHLTLGFTRTEEKEQLVANLNMDFIRHDKVRTCTAIGESGTLRWDGVLGRVDYLKAGEFEWTTLYSDQLTLDESYRAEWLDFLSCIRNGKTPQVNGYDALNVLKVVDAARSSARNGREIEVH